MKLEKLDAAEGLRLVGDFKCMVHLLPEFRISEISNFQKKQPSDMFLVSANDDAGASSGFMLYKYGPACASVHPSVAVHPAAFPPPLLGPYP